MCLLCTPRRNTILNGQFLRNSHLVRATFLQTRTPGFGNLPSRSGNGLRSRNGRRSRARSKSTGAPAGAHPARRAAQKASRPTPSQGILALTGVTLTLPLAWFVKPLRAAIAAVIRPPTASTRRRQRVIEMPLPMAAFARLILPFNTGELSGLEWLDEAKTQLKPTKEGSGFNCVSILREEE